MYYIFEIQEQNDGIGTALQTLKSDRNEAFSKYHEILQYAAISNVPIHTATILDSKASCLAKETFYHNDLE